MKGNRRHRFQVGDYIFLYSLGSEAFLFTFCAVLLGKEFFGTFAEGLAYINYESTIEDIKLGRNREAYNSKRLLGGCGR